MINYYVVAADALKPNTNSFYNFLTNFSRCSQTLFGTYFTFYYSRCIYLMENLLYLSYICFSLFARFNQKLTKNQNQKNRKKNKQNVQHCLPKPRMKTHHLKKIICT